MMAWQACAALLLLCGSYLFVDAQSNCNKDQRPGAVENYSVTAVGQTTNIKVSWNAPRNKACVDYYRVEVRPANGRGAKQFLTAGRPGKVITNLKPNTAYIVDVVPVSKRHGVGNYASATAHTQQAAGGNAPRAPAGGAPKPAAAAAPKPAAAAANKPAAAAAPKASGCARLSAPRDVKGRAVGSAADKVLITWTPPASSGCLSGYKVEVYDQTTGSTVLRTNLDSKVQELTVSGLARNSKYAIYIVPQSSAGDGPNAIVQVTTTAGFTPQISTGAVNQFAATPSPARPTPAPTRAAPAPASAPARAPIAAPAVRAPTPAPAPAPAPAPVAAPAPTPFWGFFPFFSRPAPQPAAAPVPAPQPAAPQPAAPQPAAPQPAAPQPAAPQPAPTRQVEAAPVPTPAAPAAATTAAGGCRSNVLPASPITFTATPDGSDKITLKWGDGDAGTCTDTYKVDGYVVKTGDRVVEAKTRSTSYTLTKLKPDVEYVFTISAVNSAGDSVPATAMATIPKPKN